MEMSVASQARLAALGITQNASDAVGDWVQCEGTQVAR